MKAYVAVLLLVLLAGCSQPEAPATATPESGMIETAVEPTTVADPVPAASSEDRDIQSADDDFEALDEAAELI